MRKALSLLRLALEYAPSDPEIEIALARILVRELDFARGRAILATLERRFPLLADVYVAQADVAAETQDFAESVLRLDTALAFVPGDSNIRFRRAEILHADGRAEEALADLEICERAEGPKIRTHALRARVLRALGRESDALAEELRASSIRQDESPEVEKYLDEAEGYMKNGQLGRAIEILNLAEEKDPTHPDIYYERAKIRVELFKEKSDFGEFSRALLDYARSLELDPLRAEQFLARAREIAFYINLESVLQELDTLMEHSGDRSSAHFARGFLLYMRATLSKPDPELLEEAVRAYSTALRINAENVIALVLRGMALHRLDRFEEALADYRRAEAIQPDFGLLYYASACCHARMGQPEPALLYIERMLSTGPDSDLCSRLKVESELAGLREDPRMKELLAKYCPGGG
jgi:tetratricopeptide (TPR) repeat protein